MIWYENVSNEVMAFVRKYPIPYKIILLNLIIESFKFDALKMSFHYVNSNPSTSRDMCEGGCNNKTNKERDKVEFPNI
jgi:hypothetical protein